jgi:Glycoside hydrolase 123, catalytic domain
VEKGAVERQSLNPDDPRVATHLASFLPALYTHLKEKGWLPQYIQHVLDEAHGSEPPVYLRYVPLIRKYLPGVPTIDAIDQTAGLLGDACDIWVPQLGKFDDGFQAIAEHVKKGGQAWYYTCLYPQGRYLNRFIDYPLLKTRLLPWFDFRYGLTGFLHWGGNDWAADPFQNTEPALEDGKEVLPAGDAFITYPWRDKYSIHSSIRLEAMREGIEDYELLRALAAKNPEKAKQIAHTAIPQLTDYVRDVPAFRRLEAELLKSVH